MSIVVCCALVSICNNATMPRDHHVKDPTNIVHKYTHTRTNNLYVRTYAYGMPYTSVKHFVHCYIATCRKVL